MTPPMVGFLQSPHRILAANSFRAAITCFSTELRDMPIAAATSAGTRAAGPIEAVIEHDRPVSRLRFSGAGPFSGPPFW